MLAAPNISFLILMNLLGWSLASQILFNNLKVILRANFYPSFYHINKVRILSIL